MKPVTVLAALVAALITAGAAIGQAPSVPANIAAAVADAGRPQADRARDPERKPGESIAFAGLKRGAAVADLLPGGGYFTRIFSKAVGPKGHVYAVVPEEAVKMHPASVDAIRALAADPAYANVTVVVTSLAAMQAPQPLDLVWTSQNYHDLHDPAFGPADMAKVNGAVFAALKPGGVFLVLDHAAQAGSGVRDTNTLHRIDKAVVKTEVTAAGFTLVGESDILRNPADTHTLKVFDPAIRGHTDQFILKFRKPAH